MLIFKFAGNLRRFYRQISLNVDTPAQGLRLLLAQDFEFKKAFLNTKLRVRVAGEDVEESAMQWHLDRHLKDGSVVLFVPVVEGAISAAAAAWIAVAVSVASVAYSVYMSRNMKTKTSAKPQRLIRSQTTHLPVLRTGWGRAGRYQSFSEKWLLGVT